MLFIEFLYLLNQAGFFLEMVYDDPAGNSRYCKVLATDDPDQVGKEPVCFLIDMQGITSGGREIIQVGIDIFPDVLFLRYSPGFRRALKKMPIFGKTNENAVSFYTCELFSDIQIPSSF